MNKDNALPDENNRNNETSENKLVFPFKVQLSLGYLIDFWRNVAKQESNTKSSIAKSVIANLKEVPELGEPIEDLSLIEKHRDLVDLLMTANFSPAQWESHIKASIPPFQMTPFYSTPLFDKMMKGIVRGTSSKTNLGQNHWIESKIIKAYSFIFRKFYGIESSLETDLAFRIEDEVTGLDRYFNVDIDLKFVHLNINGELPVLSNDDIALLQNNVTDFQLWYKLLPPKLFEFSGFAIVDATDVTHQEVLSSLKHDLLEKESIISLSRFLLLQHKLRSLFKNPDVQLGLVAFPLQKEFEIDFGRKIGHSFVLDQSCAVNCSNVKNSLYHKAVSSKRPVIVSNLKNCKEKSEIEQKIVDQNINSLIIAPLIYQEELLGILELGSPAGGDLTSYSLHLLNEILPLFSIAVKRSLEEYESHIQTIIKEECTAIHHSVDWRFRKAAINLIERIENDKSAEMEEIVFDEVYPLYGLSDIRDSSLHRNETIQSDLIEHLRMASDIIKVSSGITGLPLLDEIGHRINSNIDSIKNGLHSGDEVLVMEFLQTEVEHLFDHLSKLSPDLNSLIKNYQSALNPDTKIFYEKRKYYENSVALINDTISGYLDQAEKTSQEFFPHYFEKYKTDGVEHSIYIGASLVNNRDFNFMYVKNLRLWQLITMCEIVRRLSDIKSKMKMPLDTAHLILVQDTPLSIRFRRDEKNFDVDGTYNIRYEIMKKRIDKASINDGKERLTQPGKISIVYSQPKEAKEYLTYINFLQAENYLKPGLEKLDLDQLQGVSGLKALRVEVNLDGTQKDTPEKIIEEVIQKSHTREKELA